MNHQQATVFANLKTARSQAEKMALELDNHFPKKDDEDERNHFKRYLIRIDGFLEAVEEALEEIWGGRP